MSFDNKISVNTSGLVGEPLQAGGRGTVPAAALRPSPGLGAGNQGGRSGSRSWVLGAGTELEGWQNVPRAYQEAKVKALQCVLCSVSTVLVRTQHTSSYELQNADCVISVVPHVN